MISLVSLLAEHGGMLALGATCCLALGVWGMLTSRSPIRQLRSTEMAVALAVLWLIPASMPLDANPPYGQNGPTVKTVKAVREAPRRIALPVAARVPRKEDARSAGKRSPARSEKAQSEVAQAKTRAADAVLPPARRERIRPAASEVVSLSTGPRADRRWRAIVPGRNATAPTMTARNLAGAYLAGAVGCLAWLALGRLLLGLLCHSGQRPDEWLEQLYASLQWGRSSRRPRLLVSRRCGRPLTCGLWRTAIVLPHDACRPENAEQLRHVLRHELGHAAQRDAWGQCLFNLTFPLLYFHPLYWWLRGRAHLCRELLADDWAASQATKESYVRELIGLIAGRSRGHHLRFGVLGAFHTSTEFYRRMTMLLEREGSLERRCTWWWRVAALSSGVLAALLLACAFGLPVAAGEGNTVLAALATDDDGDRDDDDEEDDDDAEDDESEDDNDDDDDADDDAGDEDEDDDEDEDEDEEGDDDDEDEGDDDDDEESDDDDDEESDDDDDDREYGEDEDDDRQVNLERLLNELEKRKAELSLAELESRIREAAESREQRLAAERQAEQLDDRLGEISETLSRLAEGQREIEETLDILRNHVEELKEDRDALRDEVSSLRERIDEESERGERR